MKKECSKCGKEIHLGAEPYGFVHAELLCMDCLALAAAAKLIDDTNRAGGRAAR